MDVSDDNDEFVVKMSSQDDEDMNEEYVPRKHDVKKLPEIEADKNNEVKINPPVKKKRKRNISSKKYFFSHFYL